MRTQKEMICEIKSRNEARAEAGLPLLSIETELEKLSKAELRQDYRRWSNEHSALRAWICAEVLCAMRKERGDPLWIPRGLLNGAWEHGARVHKKMYQHWEQEREA